MLLKTFQTLFIKCFCVVSFTLHKILLLKCLYVRRDVCLCVCLVYMLVLCGVWLSRVFEGPAVYWWTLGVCLYVK